MNIAYLVDKDGHVAENVAGDEAARIIKRGRQRQKEDDDPPNNGKKPRSKDKRIKKEEVLIAMAKTDEGKKSTTGGPEKTVEAKPADAIAEAKPGAEAKPAEAAVEAKPGAEEQTAKDTTVQQPAGAKTEGPASAGAAAKAELVATADELKARFQNGKALGAKEERERLEKKHQEDIRRAVEQARQDERTKQAAQQQPPARQQVQQPPQPPQPPIRPGIVGEGNSRGVVAIIATLIIVAVLVIAALIWNRPNITIQNVPGETQQTSLTVTGQAGIPVVLQRYINSQEFGPAVKTLFPNAWISIPGDDYPVYPAADVIGFIQQKISNGSYSSYISARRSCDAATAIENDASARFSGIPLLKATLQNRSQTFLVFVTRNASGVIEIYFVAPLSGRSEMVYSGGRVLTSPSVMQEVSISY